MFPRSKRDGDYHCPVMSRVDRRLLAWIVSVAIVGVGGAIAIWAVRRSFFFSGEVGGGFGAVSVPDLSALPLVIGNLVLSFVARRRGAPTGSVILCMIGILVVATLAVSLTPPSVVQRVNSVVLLVMFGLLAIGGSLPVQLLILAILTFALIGGSRHR